MQTISVTPANGGWQVASTFGAAPLMFRRGKAAERAAVRMAEAPGSNGELVRIEVRLPDGSVARRFISSQVGRRAYASDIEWARPVRLSA